MIVKVKTEYARNRAQEVLDHIMARRKKSDDRSIARMKDYYLNRKFLWVIPLKAQVLTDDQAISHLNKEAHLFGWRSYYGDSIEFGCLRILKGCDIAEENNVEYVGFESDDIKVFKWFDD